MPHPESISGRLFLTRNQIQTLDAIDPTGQWWSPILKQQQTLDPTGQYWGETSAGRMWMWGSDIHSPTDTPNPFAGTPGGAQFSPLPNPIIIGGTVITVLWAIIRGVALGGISVGTRTLIPQGIGGAFQKILLALGVVNIADWVADMGGTEQQGETAQKFAEAIALLVDTGAILPWTPRKRMGPDGSVVQFPPKFLILDLDQEKGYFSRFHMSRSGLQAHDDKQDTYKRSRSARRSNRAPRRKAS